MIPDTSKCCGMPSRMTKAGKVCNGCGSPFQSAFYIGKFSSTIIGGK